MYIGVREWNVNRREKGIKARKKVVGEFLQLRSRKGGEEAAGLPKSESREGIGKKKGAISETPQRKNPSRGEIAPNALSNGGGSRKTTPVKEKHQKCFQGRKEILKGASTEKKAWQKRRDFPMREML